ncbi:hypothetical protein T10_6148 [Trichinella papuae]|uniref:Uncharacterized protein n=1 Tax=Trichinella papuae TaxID=268474 RepID=A0A0V1MUQ8_9BILA|nr:hypothetical protein T10_6148 [Trichinella papuae]
MDTPTDQPSSLNDSGNMLNHKETSSATFDLERINLEHELARLHGLVSRAADMNAIREVSRTLERTKQAFLKSCQRRLNNIPEEEKAKIVDEYSKLAEKVLQVQQQADELLATSHVPSSETIPPPRVNNSQLNSNRPILKLPTFDGDILQFKAFWDQFNTAVQRREDLEDVTKFVHLRSCLAGPALHAISVVTTAAENYPAMVQLLHDRFYRVSDVLDPHILKIFSVTNKVAKGKEGLLAMYDKLNGHLLELKAIRKDLDTAVSGFRMALPQLVAQLPKNVQSRWKDQCGKLSEEPTSQTLLDFLSEQARCAVDSE